MNIQSDQKAILAAFFCNFFWGLNFLASRIALNDAESQTGAEAEA